MMILLQIISMPYIADNSLENENNVPLLTQQYIHQLFDMVEGISYDNKRSLEEIINEKQSLEQTSILTLYNLTVEEWHKKQKIIENVCHFTLSMMSTVQYLWQKQNQNIEKQSELQNTKKELQHHLDHLNDQNQGILFKLSEAESQLQLVSFEKDKIYDFYHSQSCCNIMEKIEPDIHFKSQVHNQSAMLLQTEQSQLLQEKESIIMQLQNQNCHLEQKYQDLIEENELSKMEIELAEIAIKEVMSSRQSSIVQPGSSSSISIIENDPMMETPKSCKFISGELQCFSNQNSFMLEQSKISSNEESFEIQQSNEIFFSESINSSNMSVITDSNPFKKKIAPSISMVEPNSPFSNSFLISHQVSQLQKSQLFKSKKKTVSLQCNLLKNIPKIQFFKKEKKIEGNKKELKSQNKKKKSKTRKQTLNVQHETIKQTQSDIEVSGEGAFSKLFSFFSNKLITKRIKTK